MRCDGCLDSRSCWVCLGWGELERRDADPVPCHRCHGTGVCPLCAASDGESRDHRLAG